MMHFLTKVWSMNCSIELVEQRRIADLSGTLIREYGLLRSPSQPHQATNICQLLHRALPDVLHFQTGINTDQSGILVEFNGLGKQFHWLGDVLCGHKRWPKPARPCPRMTSPGFSQPVKDVGAYGGNGSALSQTSHNSADQVFSDTQLPACRLCQACTFLIVLNTRWLTIVIERQG
jgi:hypothetical protein